MQAINVETISSANTEINFDHLFAVAGSVDASAEEPEEISPRKKTRGGNKTTVISKSSSEGDGAKKVNEPEKTVVMDKETRALLESFVAFAVDYGVETAKTKAKFTEPGSEFRMHVAALSAKLLLRLVPETISGGWQVELAALLGYVGLWVVPNVMFSVATPKNVTPKL